MFILLILACLLVSSTVASPISIEDKDGAREADDSSPDLLSVLDSFKGENPMQTLSNFIKEYRIITNVLKKIMLMSPFNRKVLDNVAKTNVELRLGLKLVDGKVPDIHDMYDLLRHRKKGLSQALSASYNDSLQYQKLKALILNRKSILDSTQSVQTFLDVLTGKNITFDSDLVAEIRKKVYKPTNANIAEYNALILLSSWQINFKNIMSITTALTDGSTAYLGMLKLVEGLDFSLLSHIKVIQPQLNNSKYSVSSPEALLTDPDAVQMQQDRLKAQQLLSETSPEQEQAEMLISDMLNRAINLVYRVVEALESSQGIDATTSSMGSPSFG